MGDIESYIPFIFVALFMVGGIILLKIALAITKAESKTNMKWVVGSFFLQFGISLFVSLPMLLDMILEDIIQSNGYNEGPNGGLIAMAVIFSILIDLNLTNVIHRAGLKRSLVIALIILGPIVGSNYLIFENLGNVISL
jgi:hypothetical protein